TIRLVILAGAVFLGWRMPDVVLSRLAARRQVRLEQGLPDALDLLVFCAEAGLSLDQAIEQVAQDLRSSSLDVAGEFATAAAAMRSKTWRRERVFGACAASSRRSTSRSGLAHPCPIHYACSPPKCVPSA